MGVLGEKECPKLAAEAEGTGSSFSPCPAALPRTHDSELADGNLLPSNLSLNLSFHRLWHFDHIIISQIQTVFSVAIVSTLVLATAISCVGYVRASYLVFWSLCPSTTAPSPVCRLSASRDTYKHTKPQKNVFIVTFRMRSKQAVNPLCWRCLLACSHPHEAVSSQKAGAVLYPDMSHSANCDQQWDGEALWLGAEFLELAYNCAILNKLFNFSVIHFPCWENEEITRVSMW